MNGHLTIAHFEIRKNKTSIAYIFKQSTLLTHRNTLVGKQVHYVKSALSRKI